MTFPCVNTIQLGPSPFNSSPQCKKKLFTSSFQAKFLKIWFTKATGTSIKSYVAVKEMSSPGREVPGACFGPQSHTEPHLEHTEKVTFLTERGRKRVKEWR